MPDPVTDDPTTLVVGAGHAGKRLDKVLAALLGESRSHVQRLIDADLVTVDGEVANKSMKPEEGQTITVGIPAPVVVAPPPEVPIRWEDGHLAVVATPADLVVHAGAGVRGPTLVDALLAQGMVLAPGEDPERPGIVHRLDRGTSGLLVVSKTAEAMAGLKAMFRVHDVDRAYWALVEGLPDPPEATIDAPIVRSPRNRTTFTTGDGGRDAVTHYRVETHHPVTDTTELEVTLETGRTHQVRVHMRAVGRPVAGDIAYAANTLLSRRLRLERQALHAKRLSFVHPITGGAVDVTEPLPEDLEHARLRASGSS